MIYRRSEKVAFSTLDGEVCIFHSESGEYLNLNSTGSLIWDLLGEINNEDDLIKAVTAEYVGNKNSIRNEVLEFLKKALDLNILQASNE